MRVLLLALGLLACGQRATLPVDADPACTPAFRKLSEERVGAEVGSFQVDFSVALLGCKERLRTLTEREVKMIRQEFIEPTDWSTHEVYSIPMHVGFRSRVVNRLNEILGRDVITDVFVYSVSREDPQ